MTDQRVRVDAGELTLGELADLEVELGGSLDTIMEGSQARGIAGIVWVVKRRDDPDFTFDQALGLRMADLELVQAGEAQGDGNGSGPLPSPESGP